MLDISCESSAAILLGALRVNVYANIQACLKPKALRTAKTLLLHYPPISPKLSIRSIKRKKSYFASSVHCKKYPSILQ